MMLQDPDAAIRNETMASRILPEGNLGKAERPMIRP